MDKEITIINKEKFCDIYNRINETVDLDEKYANAAERAPMNQKENLPVYTNCKGEKLVDLVGQNNCESADNGAIAVLSMATLVRWIGGGHYNNRALSAANLASAGLIANGVKYIIVYDDAKEPYSLVWGKDGTYKIGYITKDKFNYLILENPETFFFSLPFEDEAEEILQSDEEEFVEEEDETEEQNIAEKAEFIDNTSEPSVVELSGADIEKDTVIDVIAIKGIDARVYNTGSGPFSTSKTDDWLDPIFVREGKEKGKETKLEVLKNFALICPDKEGKFVLNRFIRSDSEIKELIGAMRHPSEDSDCKWQKLIIANNETLFVGASVTMLVFLDHELVLEERFVEILKENNVNVKIISLGASNNAVQNADQDWIAGWCSNTSYEIGKKVIEILG